MAAEHRIFLGVLDEECSSSKSGFSVTKIGGLPDWPQECNSFWPTCSFCNERLCLAVQINCPLDNDTRDRTIFVLVCANLVCQRQLRKQGLSQYECGYWLAVRICRDNTRTDRSGQVSKMQSDEWGTEQEDWDIDEAASSSSKANVGDSLSCQFGAISLQSAVTSSEAIVETSKGTAVAHCDSAEHSGSGRKFASYFISVMDEHEAIRSFNAESDRHIQKLLTDYRLNTGTGSDLSRAEEFEETDEQGSKRSVQFANEPYEKTTLFSRDAAYRRFLKRIKAFPSQLVRYNVDSRSGMASAARDAALHTAQRFVDCVAPRCAFCGAARVFEFQILSTLIAVVNEPSDELPRPSKDGSAVEMSEEPTTDSCKAVIPDFGTVIIFTCEKSCWLESEAQRIARDSPFRVEHILIEPECTV